MSNEGLVLALAATAAGLTAVLGLRWLERLRELSRPRQPEEERGPDDPLQALEVAVRTYAGGTGLAYALARAYRDHSLEGVSEFEIVAHPIGWVLLYRYPSTHTVGTTFAVLTRADFDRYATLDGFVAGMVGAFGEVWQARIGEISRLNVEQPGGMPS